MKTKRQHIGTTMVGGSQLELYLCSRVERGGKRYPAFQNDNVVEFDRRLSMDDLARLGAALACREYREMDGWEVSDGPLYPVAHVDVEGTPYAVRMVEKGNGSGDGVLCFRACCRDRELLVARYTRRHAVFWGIGAAETAWDYLAWQRGERRTPPEIPAAVTLCGVSYAVKVSPCPRLYVRDESGHAEAARLFLDHDDRTVLLPKNTDPNDWPDVVSDLEESAAREQDRRREAA
jgi:hypothetical protein